MSRETKYYETLEELYRDNFKFVHILTGDYTDDIHMKNDISSLIWEKVARQPEKYLSMDRYRLRNYLRIMVKNTYIDYFRSPKSMCEELTDRNNYSYDGDFCEVDFYKEELKYLGAAVKTLNMEEKQLLVMRFAQNMSAKETGEVFGISEGAVRVRQSRILVKLKKEILRFMKEDESI